VTFVTNNVQRRTAMPAISIVLWAIPAIVIIGGGVYWVAHLH
jgi:hypothetical protein